MLIVISTEKFIENEEFQLKSMLDEGLEVLHIRKPNVSFEALKTWLEKFDPQHRSKMVLHQHHKLAQEFDLKGIHLTEYFRTNLAENIEDYVNSFQQKKFTVSTSVHQKEMLSESIIFDYCFLSPVFNSISKAAYPGKKFQVNELQQKVIALGGIDSEKISAIKQKGFSGAAVLGAVWMQENPTNSFIKIQQEYESVFN
ncbi:thiamine phosphate synthase [Zunongwangia endophytica]|uniref:Thiamine phosphate synthase n=1 Tax=Zunongwangia endophytica TaxID=1808945 RepID=A0ABV8H6H8_9FLAO|nr:thiamine phosphate synthase [Zunongwangia endophytica]MDN3596043.1 thiamine phosphate synthase [Zunongwangia endophytica]